MGAGIAVVAAAAPTGRAVLGTAVAAGGSWVAARASPAAGGSWVAARASPAPYSVHKDNTNIFKMNV